MSLVEPVFVCVYVLYILFINRNIPIDIFAQSIFLIREIFFPSLLFSNDRMQNSTQSAYIFQS